MGDSLTKSIRRFFQSRWIGPVCVVVMLAALSMPQLHAQVLYGSIVGNVRDQSQASVPGATITITSRETNLSR